MGSIDTQVWVANPDKPGYLQLERTRTIGEVYRDIRAAFGEYPEGAEEYLSVIYDFGAPDRGTGEPWPEGRIAVYPVTGGSEGHYVHVDVIPSSASGKRIPVLLAKTFAGWDAAWYFARNLAERLEV